jgi:hypothetical protein
MRNKDSVGPIDSARCSKSAESSEFADACAHTSRTVQRLPVVLPPPHTRSGMSASGRARVCVLVIGLTTRMATV